MRLIDADKLKEHIRAMHSFGEDVKYIICVLIDNEEAIEGEEKKPAHMSRNEVLDTAKNAINGERQQDYGKPGKCFLLISRLWSVYLGHPVSPKDVAFMMILLKIARAITGKGTADCYVDICGYAALGAELEPAAWERDKEL